MGGARVPRGSVRPARDPLALAVVGWSRRPSRSGTPATSRSPSSGCSTKCSRSRCVLLCGSGGRCPGRGGFRLDARRRVVLAFAAALGPALLRGARGLLHGGAHGGALATLVSHAGARNPARAALPSRRVEPSHRRLRARGAPAPLPLRATPRRALHSRRPHRLQVRCGTLRSSSASSRPGDTSHLVIRQLPPAPISPISPSPQEREHA